MDRMKHVIDVSEIGVFFGLDVGKGEHHATAVIPAGRKAFDKRLPSSEPKLRDDFGKLQAKCGTVLVGVDQPASIGALLLAVDRGMGWPVAYLPNRTRLSRAGDDRRLRRRPGRRNRPRKAACLLLVDLLRPKAPWMAEHLAGNIYFTALDKQNVVVPGTDAATA
jgi:hypothetical protein